MARNTKTSKEKMSELIEKMEKLEKLEDERKTPIGISIVGVIETIIEGEITLKDVDVIHNFLLEQEERGTFFSRFMFENAPKKKVPKEKPQEDTAPPTTTPD